MDAISAKFFAYTDINARARAWIYDDNNDDDDA